MAVVFVTHDLAVARLMGERIAVLFDGEIVESGDAGQILRAPAHPRTRALLTAVPRIDTASRTDTAPRIPSTEHP
jgi:ABC-type dipeptide/oligopeptide/nickel transport system ATPase component